MLRMLRRRREGSSFYIGPEITMKFGYFSWIGSVNIHPRKGICANGMFYMHHGEPKTRREADAKLYYDLLEIVMPILEVQKRRCERIIREEERKNGRS